MTKAPLETPPDDLTVRRGRQLWLLASRLLVALLLLGGNIVFGANAGFTRDALMLLITLSFGVSLAALVLLPRVERLVLLASIQIAFDLALVTGLIYLVGGAASGFSFLYGVVILASALVIGPRAPQLVTAAALTLYVAVGLGLANGWIPPPVDSPDLGHEVPIDVLGLSMLRNLVGLILVGLLAGSLAERLRRTGGQLQEATQTAAEQVRLNEDILRSLGSGLLTTDLGGVVRLINPAGAALLGGVPAEIEGRPVSDVLPLTAEAEEVRRAEGEATRIDEYTFPVGFGTSALRDTAGERLGTLVLFQDLTELQDLREKAERAERLAALGRLSAGLAHEIRNPLGSISGSVQMVSEAAELSEEDRHLLTLVLGEVDRLDDLVTTMLQVGRPRDPDPISVDAGRLARDVARVAERSSKVTVSVTSPADPVRVHADPGQLRQVLWNLTKNAIQFSPPEGDVRIEVGIEGDSTPTIAVRDTGPGISEADREHVFDVFYSKRHHGVGLGLALVRQIVDAHGASISVESELGQGTCFTVRFPPDEATSDEATSDEEISRNED